MALTADDILAHSGNYVTVEVHVPKWRNAAGDDVVILRSMTIKEYEVHQGRLQRELAAAEGQEKGEASARMLARLAISESGARVFTDDQVNQIANLGFAEVNRLMEAVNNLNGIGEDAEKQAEIDKAAAGKSEAQTSSSE